MVSPSALVMVNDCEQTTVMVFSIDLIISDYQRQIFKQKIKFQQPQINK